MNLLDAIKSILKAQFDDSPWNGAASQWDTAEAYCSDCLIDLNEAGQPKTKDKCKLPYRKPGSNAVNKGALRAIASGARGLAAVDAPMEVKRRVAKWVAGKWKQAFPDSAGVPPNIARMAGMSSKEHGTNRVLITKDSNGQWWFMGIYSNKFEDLDGEILSEAAHKEYIAWLKETGFKPALTAYHLPRAKDPAFWSKVFDRFENDIPKLQSIVDVFFKPMAFAKAERVVYANGFTLVIGKFFEGKDQIAERLSQRKDLGMSHGFINKESDGNIFNKYRTFEMSILRNARAANPFTLSGASKSKDLNMAGKAKEKGLTAEDRDAIAQIFGEEALNKIEKDTEVGGDILSRLLSYKMDEEEVKASDTEDATEEDAPEEEDDTMPMNKKEAEDEGLTLDVVAKGVADLVEQLQPVITEMQEKISALEAENVALKAQVTKQVAEVEEIKKSEDEKIAKSWLPPLDWRAGYSASKATDNIVKEEEKKELTENAPQNTRVQPKNEVMSFALPAAFLQGRQG